MIFFVDFRAQKNWEQMHLSSTPSFFIYKRLFYSTSGAINL